MSCLFCRIVSREIPAHVVFENEHVLIFLDIHPKAPGHLLAIPKQHADHALVTSPEDLSHALLALRQIGPTILAKLGASGARIQVNIGADAGQEVMHTHLHFIPVFEHNTVPNLGHEPSLTELAEQLFHVLS